MHVARVALRVSDVGRSAAFYERLAGLAVRGGDDAQATLGAPDGGPVLLELRRAARPGTAPRTAAGLFHTAFRYPDRAGLAAALQRLAELREPLTGASDHGVSEALYLDDPDGLGVELYRDRPREDWPAPRPGERVFMPTVPLDIDDLLTAADGELPAAASGLDVGHVHFKVADVDDAIAFWTETVGMDLMMRVGADAAFLAHDGYHHHVGANTWLSRGAPLEPGDSPGLDAVVLGGGDAEAEHLTPDGVPVMVETG